MWQGTRRWAWRDLTLGQMMSDGSSRCFIYLRFSSNPWFPLPCLDLSRICRCKRVQACGPCLFSWNFLKVCLRLKTFIVPIGQQGHLPTAPINGACQAYCGSCEWQPYLRALFNCHSSDGKHEDEDRSTCRWDWYSCMWKRWDKCPHESCQVSFFKRWFLEEPYPHASVVKDQTCNMEVHAFFVARTIGRDLVSPYLQCRWLKSWVYKVSARRKSCPKTEPRSIWFPSDPGWSGFPCATLVRWKDRLQELLAEVPWWHLTCLRTADLRPHDITIGLDLCK